MAGHTAYLGVLVALDGLLSKKNKGRKSVDWYKQQLSKIDGKISTRFDNVYDTLHLVLGYDGNLNVKIAQEGLNEAISIISWVQNKAVSNSN